ncbi:hypothetical protein ACFBZI_00620 [Moraxella sp. ZJ142]|uniref:hypothetical protein n=1 Tax=Moraxella marmotae TaxID=3344520 RepID=UPI0035D4538A
MLSNPKNALTIDITLRPTKAGVWLWWGVIALVWLLCLAADLSWWQWLILLLITIFISHYYQTGRANDIQKFSTRQIDGVWLLAGTASTRHAPKPPRAIVYQAYLQKITAVNLGITQAVILQFFVILPKKSPKTLMIFGDQLTPSERSQLLALAKLYGK